MNSTYLKRVTVVPDDNKGTAYISFTTANESSMEYFLLNHDGTLTRKETFEGKQEWEVPWTVPGTDCVGHLEAAIQRNHQFARCEGNGSSNLDKKDGFLKLTTMKVPELADWVSGPKNECEKQCLMNCSCTAYAYYQGIGCMSWSGNLVDIQKFSSHGADLYIRVAYSEIDKKRNMKFLTAVSVIIGSIIMAICAYFAWTWMAKQKGTDSYCCEN
ncbi:hypothetical protein C3L33_06345, partial [Rhododendron williamsianum]